MDKMRWISVFVFATIYFFFTIMLDMLYSWGKSEIYALQHFWTAFPATFMRLTLYPLALFIIILCSFILGFITDWVLRALKRHIPLRKREQRIEFNHPKT